MEIFVLPRESFRKLKIIKRIIGEPFIVTDHWHTGGKPHMCPFIPKVETETGHTRM